MIGFKCFMQTLRHLPALRRSDAGRVRDTGAARHALHRARGNGLDPRSPRGPDARSWPRRPARASAARPPVAAMEAVQRAALYAEWTGARLHIAHVSSADELRPSARPRRAASTSLPRPARITWMLDTDDSRCGSLIRVNPGARTAPQGIAVDGDTRSHDRHDLDRPRAAHTGEKAATISDRHCGFPGSKARCR